MAKVVLRNDKMEMNELGLGRQGMGSNVHTDSRSQRSPETGLAD